MIVTVKAWRTEDSTSRFGTIHFTANLPRLTTATMFGWDGRPLRPEESRRRVVSLRIIVVPMP